MTHNARTSRTKYYEPYRDSIENYRLYIVLNHSGSGGIAAQASLVVGRAKQVVVTRGEEGMSVVSIRVTTSFGIESEKCGAQVEVQKCL